MEPVEYQRMFELEDHHWWFQGRLDLVCGLMDRYAPVFPDRKTRLLDIGCGTGLFLGKQSQKRETFGLDFSFHAMAFSRGRGLERLVCADSQKLPYAANSFDVLTAFDIIEHVEGDQAIVNEALRVLRPGGVMLATVPAHPSLWSSHDIALHHKRRYMRPQFDQLFDKSKWNTIRYTWAFCSIYPAALAVRSLRKLVPKKGEPQADTGATNPLLNSMLTGWHKLESAWAQRLDLPWGLTLLTVRQKRG